LPAFFIGIYCPLDILEQREKTRKSRTLRQAKAQFSLVHVDCIYDFEVDTSVYCPEEYAQLIKARIQNGTPPCAFKSLKQQYAA
jgi:chloramphenicol 3-O phosphotransferase